MIGFCLPYLAVHFLLSLVLNNIDLPFIWVQFQLIRAWYFSFSLEHSLTTHHSSPFTWLISFLSLHIVMNIQLSQEKLPLLLDLVSSTKLHTPLTQQLSKCGPWIFRNLRPFWGSLQIQSFSVLKLTYYLPFFFFFHWY